jgi:hypothetical protein
MNNSIQYFEKNGIPKLIENKKNFMKDPSHFEDCVKEVKNIMLDLGCHFLSEMLEECNIMLEDSWKRRENWHIKDRTKRSLLTSIGTVKFTHTRFLRKKTKETAYLLDQLMELKPHVRISQDVEEIVLEEAVQSSYRKAGQSENLQDGISAETVMHHIHNLQFSKEERKEGLTEKKKVENLYVESDEDHISLQFHNKKGDVKRFKNYGDNGRIVKLAYVHEGHQLNGKQKELINTRYFGGMYPGKENEILWKEVVKYIEETYDEESLKTIYFQSDGGSWMKRGIEELNAVFVLDEFHIKKYIKRLAYLAGEKENWKELEEWVEQGKRKTLKNWMENKKSKLDEKTSKKLEESFRYIERNWKAIRKRVKKEEGVLGSSTESHISHVLSARMSSRPMGWSKIGADKLSRLRIYWKNGESMQDLLNYQKGVPLEGSQTEEGYLTVKAIRDWEKRTTKRNGKYVAALQASISSQMQARMYFHSTLSEFLG